MKEPDKEWSKSTPTEEPTIEHCEASEPQQTATPSPVLLSIGNAGTRSCDPSVPDVEMAAVSQVAEQKAVEESANHPGDTQMMPSPNNPAQLLAAEEGFIANPFACPPQAQLPECVPDRLPGLGVEHMAHGNHNRPLRHQDAYYHAIVNGSEQYCPAYQEPAYYPFHPPRPLLACHDPTSCLDGNEKALPGENHLQNVFGDDKDVQGNEA
ncbi:hypothetical protein EDC04DRAFT_2607243 [Pisolithus marmoratus]|nr:hypothetical protein EDC04DRAFT_2607243 [Pisolithus marmoratus]